MVLFYLDSCRRYWNCDDARFCRVLLWGAVLARFLLAFAPIMLTGDIARYLWEGKLLRAGMSPFQIAPDASIVAQLRDTNWNAIEYKHMTAIYPPVAQYLFAAFGHSELCWRLFLCGLETLSLVLLLATLGRSGIPRGRFVIYAFLPLSIMEIAMSGHLEGVLVFCTVLLLFLCSDAGRASPVRLAALFGLLATIGIWVKYIFLIPVLYALAAQLPLRAWLTTLLSFALGSFLVVVFFPGHLDGLFTSFGQYLQHWRFNDSLFHLLGFLFDVDWSDSQSFILLKYALACLWGCLSISLAVWSKNWVRSAVLCLMTLLLFSPVVHPWYLLWFAPLLCFYPSAAAIYFCISVCLSYASRVAPGMEALPLWLKLLEYLPVYVLLLLEFVPRRRTHP